MLAVIIFDVMDSKSIVVTISSCILIIIIGTNIDNGWICCKMEWIRVWPNESIVGHSLPFKHTKSNHTSKCT